MDRLDEMAQDADHEPQSEGDRAQSSVSQSAAASAGSGTALEYGGLSEQGPARRTHEDTISHTIPADPDLLDQKGALFVIADGVGGHGGGDIASREGAKVLTTHYFESKSLPERALKGAMGESNLYVYDLGVKIKRPMLSTTLSAIAIVGSRFHVVHIGDSRIYRLREHTDIEQLTDDHSEAAELVRMQIVRPENLRGHPRRHVVTRALGSEAVARPMAKSGNVQAGDYFVLCTDGLWEFLEDDEISEIVRFLPPGQACREMVNRVLGRSPSDNISVQVVRIVSVDETLVKPQSSGGLYRAVMRLFGSDE